MLQRASCVRSVMASCIRSKVVSSLGIPGSWNQRPSTRIARLATVFQNPVQRTLERLDGILGEDIWFELRFADILKIKQWKL